jgi:nucleoside-diphosphate-sugar epimerase
MDFFTSDSEFNIERAKTTMGWEPRVGLLDGVNRTLAAYQSQID